MKILVFLYECIFTIYPTSIWLINEQKNKKFHAVSCVTCATVDTHKIHFIWYQSFRRVKKKQNAACNCLSFIKLNWKIDIENIHTKKCMQRYNNSTDFE